MFYSAFVVFSVTCDLPLFHMSSFCRLLITSIKQKTACSFCAPAMFLFHVLYSNCINTLCNSCLLSCNQTQTPCWRDLVKLVVTQLVSNFLCFMEPKGLSLCSKESRAYCYPELDQSSRHALPNRVVTTHDLKEIHFIIVLPSMPKSYSGHFVRFTRQNLICTSSLPHACFMPRSHSSSFDHSDNVW